MCGGLNSSVLPASSKVDQGRVDMHLTVYIAISNSYELAIHWQMLPGIHTQSCHISIYSLAGR